MRPSVKSKPETFDELHRFFSSFSVNEIDRKRHGNAIFVRFAFRGFVLLFKSNLNHYPEPVGR